MSLKHEQHRALRLSRDFLQDLLQPAKTKRVPKEIRRRAYLCLRHYPLLKETGEPMFSRDCFDEGVSKW